MKTKPLKLISKPANFENQIRIHYFWECPSFKHEIPHELQEALNEHANERIAQAMKDGVVMGELNDLVNIEIDGVETPQEGFECSGWFEIKGML